MLCDGGSESVEILQELTEGHRDPLLSGQGRFDLFNDRIKPGRIANGKLGEHLAIEFQPRFGQAVNELAVSQTSLPDRGADADDPQLAEFPFSDAAIPIGEYAGANQRFFGGPEQTPSPADEPLGPFQQTAPGLGSGVSLNRTHGSLPLARISRCAPGRALRSLCLLLQAKPFAV